VHETILRQVVGQILIARQPAQKIPDLRLVALDQFAEGAGVDLRDGPRDEIQVVCFAERGLRFQVDVSFSPNLDTIR
jgi:hypothetical protein